MASAQWILCSLLCVHLSLCDEFVFPANEFVYSIQRDALKAAEMKLQGVDYALTKDEEIVDHYLNYLKWKEFERTRETGFPPSRPIEETLDNIVQSEVFDVLQSFPKGGLLHTHENHQLSKKILLDIVWDSDDFQHLHILPENDTVDPLKIDFFINPPEGEGWEKVIDHQDIYNKETLVKHYNLIGILDEYAMNYPTDSKKRWDLMDTLWSKASAQIMANRPIKIRHLEELYKHSINEGVTYLETRKHLGSGDELIYVLDESPEYADTNGKHYLDTDGQLDVSLTLEVLANFTALNPEFIGHKRIVYTQRQQSLTTIAADMERTKMLHELFPDHVIGYDLVGHEDAGNSQLYYVAEFLKQYNEETQKSNIDFFFHISETKWTDDISASMNAIDDPVGASQNIYEAVLLGAKRIGHGTGYLKHPYLLQLIEERNVAVEICPVSGMVLGYFPDLRSHPGIYHFRNGGKVVLGSDDAGSFGFDHFTVDWYDVCMSWGLDLKDLRQLALNSLRWSAMSESDKTDAIDNKWSPLWDLYIENTKTKACNANLTQATPTFARILPRHGPTTGANVVHVFGRNFERAICSDVKCIFDDMEASQTQYISNQHIACVAPSVDVARQKIRSLSAAIEVSVKVVLDGEEFETGEIYQYREDLVVSTVPTTTSGDPSAAVGIRPCNPALILMTLAVLYIGNDAHAHWSV